MVTDRESLFFHVHLVRNEQLYKSFENKFKVKIRYWHTLNKQYTRKAVPQKSLLSNFFQRSKLYYLCYLEKLFCS